MPYLKNSKGKTIFISDHEVRKRIAMAEVFQELKDLSDDEFMKRLEIQRQENALLESEVKPWD